MATTRRKQQQQQQADDQDLAAGAPLFEGGAEFDHIAVTRVLPQEDAGYLGTMPKDATLEDLRAAYGGGKFSLVPRDSSSHYIKGLGSRTETIAGTPIFSNELARKRWLKQQGVEEPKAGAAAPAGERAPSMMEMMLFMQKQAEINRAEMQAAAAERQREQEASRTQREREAEQAHQRQLQLVQLQVEQQTAALKAERERLREEAKEQRERDREWLQMMSATKAADGGGLKGALELLATAKELFGGGDGEPDPVAALAANAPAIMEQLARMGGGGKAGAAAPAGAVKAGGKGEPLVLEGELGAEAAAFLRDVEKRGGDPAAVMGQLIRTMHGRLKAAGRGQAAAAPPPVAASGKTEASKATPAPKGGTKKSAPPGRAAAAR